MRYLLKVQSVPESKFRDDAFAVCGKTYSYESLVGAELVKEADDDSQGEIRIKLSNGTFNWIPFNKEDKDIAAQVLDFLKTHINHDAIVMEQGKDAMAETAYNYSVMHALGSDISRSWGIRHFLVAMRMLLPSEQVLIPFMAEYNFDSDMINVMSDGVIAFVITDKRLLMAQKRLAGFYFQAINWDGVKNIFVTSTLRAGVVEIETMDSPVDIKMERSEAEFITAWANRVRAMAVDGDKAGIDDIASMMRD